MITTHSMIAFDSLQRRKTIHQALKSNDQLITFKGVDLTAGHALTTTADQNALIKELIDQGKLKIDHT